MLKLYRYAKQKTYPAVGSTLAAVSGTTVTRLLVKALLKGHVKTKPNIAAVVP